MEKSIHTDDYSVVTELLKEIRKSAGITQVQMAESLAQSQSLYSKYERGEIRLDVIQLRRLLRELGLSLTQFSAKLEKRLESGKTQESRRTKSSARR